MYTYHFWLTFVGEMDPSQNVSKGFWDNDFHFLSKNGKQLLQQNSAQEKIPKLFSPINCVAYTNKGNILSSAEVPSPQKSVNSLFSRKLFHCSPKKAYRQEGLTFAQVVKRNIFSGQYSPPQPANLESGSCTTFPNFSPHKVPSSMGIFEAKSPSYPHKDDCFYGIPNKKITTFYCKDQCCYDIDPMSDNSRESSVFCDIPPIFSTLNMVDEIITIEWYFQYMFVHLYRFWGIPLSSSYVYILIPLNLYINVLLEEYFVLFIYLSFWGWPGRLLTALWQFHIKLVDENLFYVCSMLNIILLISVCSLAWLHTVQYFSNPRSMNHCITFYAPMLKSHSSISQFTSEIVHAGLWVSKVHPIYNVICYIIVPYQYLISCI